MSLNPLRAWFAYRQRRDEAAARVAELERMERREDRAAFLAAVQSMASMTERAFEASRVQSAAFQTFLDGFRTPTAPVARQYDESEDTKRWLTQHGYDVPAELKGLDRIAAFDALLDHMDAA